MDLFLVHGIRALFKTVIVMFQYFEKNLVTERSSFESIMEFLSEIPKFEIFKCKKYPEYCRLKRNDASFELIKKKIKCHRACYFIYTFKEKCKRVYIPQKFVDLQENKYRVVSAKVKRGNY